LEVLTNYFGSSLLTLLKEEIEVVRDLTPRKLNNKGIYSGYSPILGKLSLKREAAGKVRVFAIVDV
jgi:hypothetical protein